MTLVPGLPEFQTQKIYQDVLNYNKAKVDEILNLAREMVALNPFLRNVIDHRTRNFLYSM